MRIGRTDEIVRSQPATSSPASPRDARGSGPLRARAALALLVPELPASPPSAGHAAVRLDDPRLAPIVADVRARLARACAHLPPDSFERLVERIAATHLRWARAEEASRRRFARWHFPAPPAPPEQR